MPHYILHTAEILYSPDFDRPKVGYGLLIDESGTILEAAPIRELLDICDERHDHQVIMPGVVNAHIHLTDAGRTETVPGGEGLVAWIRKLLADRDAGLTSKEREEAVTRTIDEIRASGTVALGEVVNNEGTLKPIMRSGMRCRYIHELIDFSREGREKIMAEAERLKGAHGWEGNVVHALGAHAPYSISPELMKSIDEWSLANRTYLYQHLAEGPDERKLYERGEGPWVEFLKMAGAWDESFVPPGVSPILFYDQLGLLSVRFVAVHLADAADGEIQLLARRGVKAVLSPTSNLHITGLLPHVREMVRVGMRLALGTDGRGSNPSMDVFDEARLLHERFPDLPPGTLLRAVTVGGADVLGFPDLGRIRVGSSPGLVAMEINEEVNDLKELERAILSNDAKRERIA